MSRLRLSAWPRRSGWLAAASFVAALSAAPRASRAQGNLSTNGLGYPTGQLSARALGSGGATGEIDPLSPLNPAALIDFGTTTVFFQIEPEYRTVVTSATSEQTTTARYPLLVAAIPVGSHWMLGVSSSTFLDATWATSSANTQVIGSDTVSGNASYRVDGAINDLRAGLAYTPVRFLRVGLGLDVFAGSHRDSAQRSFTDTVSFATFGQERTVSFTGTALTGGLELVAPGTGILAVSYRAGAAFRAHAGDTLLGTSRIPDRFGASVAFLGLTGATIAARTEFDRWSALDSLGGLRPNDAWDTSVGADVTGPHIGSRTLSFRGGFRWRTLPYPAAGHLVSERSATAGLGVLFANGHASTDLAAVRANRDAGIAVTEQAWIISLGLTIRP